jgi:hypothetical protein
VSFTLYSVPYKNIINAYFAQINFKNVEPYVIYGTEKTIAEKQVIFLGRRSDFIYQIYFVCQLHYIGYRIKHNKRIFRSN